MKRWLVDIVDAGITVQIGYVNVWAETQEEAEAKARKILLEGVRPGTDEWLVKATALVEAFEELTWEERGLSPSDGDGPFISFDELLRRNRER